MKDIGEFLATIDALTATEAEELGRLFNGATFEKDTVLYHEEQMAPAFYVIQSGKVELTRKDQKGNARMVDFLVQGDFFGEMALLEGRGLMATAKVVEEASLLFIARRDFERLTRLHPRLAVKILTFISRKLDQPERLEAFHYNAKTMRANRVLAIAGPSAGSGRTFLATNLARAMATICEEVEEGDVGLLDLHAPFGNCALHFGVTAQKDWGLFLSDLERGGEVNVRDYCVEVASSTFLLTPPEDLRVAREIQPGDVVQLVQSMRDTFARVIIDLPAGLSPIVEAAIEASDKTLVVTTYCIDALSRLRLFAKAIGERPGFPNSYPAVINRKGSSNDVHTAERDAIPMPIIGRLDNNGRVARALKEGHFWYDNHARSALTKSITELASRLTGVDDVMEERAAFLSAWLPFRQQRRGRAVAPWEREAPPMGHALFRRRRGHSRLALGEALYLDGQYFRAFQELRRAVDDCPSLSRAYTLLGEISQALARRREASTYFEAALRFDKEDLKALTSYAVLQRGKEVLQSCHERLKKALDEHPTWPDLHFQRGQILVTEGNNQDAQNAYMEALRFNSSYGAAYRGLGDLYVIQRKNTQAIEFYLKAIHFEPGDLLARHALSRVYRALGLVAPAVTTLEELVERCPHHSPAQQELLSLREALELLDDEIRTLESAVEINPDFSDNLCNLGDAYTRRGLFDKAISCFKRALRYNPDLMSAKEQMLRVKAIRERISRVAN